MRTVTVRRVVVGSLAVVGIGAFTPFNNYVVNNTDLVGSALPTSVVVVLLLAAIVNGLIGRVAPRWQFSVGELAVALGMALVACALPAAGLMRYLPGHLVQYHAMPAETPAFARAVEEMGLPDWLWPRVEGDTVAARASDPVVRNYIGRIPGSAEEPLWEQVANVPWDAWVSPIIAWGLFFLFLFGGVIFLTLIFRRQWVDNERLPFPLASVFMSLIEPPKQGRLFNQLLSSKLFWITVASVFAIHFMNGMWRYDPQHFPELPLSFNLTNVLSERPWSLAEGAFRSQTIYFTIIGIVYFADTRVALSAWVFFVGLQVVRMVLGTSGREMTGGMQIDQGMGATVAFAITILWIARQHLSEVMHQMWRGWRGNESRGRYLPHATSGWGFVICFAGMIAWLTFAGASLAGAMVIVVLLMMVYLVLAKVVAETGLLYMLIQIEFRRPWLAMAHDVPAGMQARTTVGSYFFASTIGGLLTHDERQSMAVFAPQAVRVNDLADDEPEQRRRRWPIVACLGGAIVLAFLSSGAGMIWADYTFATPLDGSGERVVSSWGSYDMPRAYSIGRVVDYLPPRDGPAEAHNRIGHATFGAGMVAVLAALRLRFVAWPFHPVGFLLLYSWGLQVTWFSIFLGWLAKSLLIRLGGSGLFLAGKPVFIGLIVGEALAAVLWLVVNLVRLSMGLPYEQIRLLPA